MLSDVLKVSVLGDLLLIVWSSSDQEPQKKRIGNPYSRVCLLLAPGGMQPLSHDVDPFCVCVCLSRREDAVAVVDGITGTYGRQAAANPNLLEFSGNSLLLKSITRRSGGRSDSSGDPGGSSGDGTTVAGVSSPSVARCPSGFRAPAATDATTAAAAATDTKMDNTLAPPTVSTTAVPPDIVSSPELGAVSEAAAVGGAAPLLSVATAPASAVAATSAASAASAATAAAAAAAATAAAINAFRAAPRCGCAGRAVVSSLAVNRVQSTYSTPVYATRGGGVVDLDRRLWRRSFPGGDACAGRKGMEMEEGGDTRPGVNSSDEAPRRGREKMRNIIS